ncbi:PrpF domain-containing protein [Brucella pituitosa]|uniref:PrpF domain-containing protein n=1 Tax=Brucella pituitosa TaxID=571256 RepID=UPI003F4AA9CD
MNEHLKIRKIDGVLSYPVHHMRGGTSTGVIFNEAYVPKELALREELLRHIFGVPLNGVIDKNSQTTGLGRGYPTSNKAFLVSMNRDKGKVSSTLAQLAATKSDIDWSVNCGNMSSAIPLWLSEIGWFDQKTGNLEVDIFNTNTGVTTLARMHKDSGGKFACSEIPGVAGQFPSVDLFLNEPVGSKTGRLLPTGSAVNIIQGKIVSCVDVAVPMVICEASEFGMTGDESPSELSGNKKLMDDLREVWISAGLLMGLKKRDGAPMTREDLARSETIPKICLVSPARGSGKLSVRYFTPQQCHQSLAVSGGCCLAAASLLPGTVANKCAESLQALTADWSEIEMAIENPAGLLEMTIKAKSVSDGVLVSRAGYRRNAQLLVEGYMSLYGASDQLRDALIEMSAS